MYRIKKSLKMKSVALLNQKLPICIEAHSILTAVDEREERHFFWNLTDASSSIREGVMAFLKSDKLALSLMSCWL